MGYYSLFAVSHDTFSRLEDNPGFMVLLRHYINSGGSREAESLAQYTGNTITVVSMRHSTDSYYISNKIAGFPAKLPYEEELGQEVKSWNEAETKAKAWLDGNLKLRTIAQLRNLVIRLIRKNKVVDAQIAAGDGVFFAQRKLADSDWRPTRSDYEALKNRLMKIDNLLNEEA